MLTKTSHSVSDVMLSSCISQLPQLRYAGWQSLKPFHQSGHLLLLDHQAHCNHLHSVRREISSSLPFISSPVQWSKIMTNNIIASYFKTWCTCTCASRHHGYNMLHTQWPCTMDLNDLLWLQLLSLLCNNIISYHLGLYQVQMGH